MRELDERRLLKCCDLASKIDCLQGKIRTEDGSPERLKAGDELLSEQMKKSASRIANVLGIDQ